MSLPAHTIPARAIAGMIAFALAACASSSSRTAFDAELAALYPRCPVVVEIDSAGAAAAWSRAQKFLSTHARAPITESHLRLTGDYGQLDHAWTLEISRIERSRQTMISVHAHAAFDYNTCDTALSREAAHFIATGASRGE